MISRRLHATGSAQCTMLSWWAERKSKAGALSRESPGTPCAAQERLLMKVRCGLTWKDSCHQVPLCIKDSQIFLFFFFFKGSQIFYQDFKCIKDPGFCRRRAPPIWWSDFQNTDSFLDRCAPARPGRRPAHSSSHCWEEWEDEARAGGSKCLWASRNHLLCPWGAPRCPSFLPPFLRKGNRDGDKKSNYCHRIVMIELSDI